MNWLLPVEEALESLSAPIMMFFRNDDAGWDDDALLRMLDVFELHGMPIDLAAIPTDVTGSLGQTLRERAERNALAVHQHGYSHTNHETIGRSCEFGPSRTRAQQQADIRQGWSRLQDVLGDVVQPIFTPPWNRCTTTTARCLADEGFTVLSRDATAETFGGSPLREIPVTIDWFRKRKGTQLNRFEIGHEIADQIRKGGPLGLMLHHAVTDVDELATLAQLIALLAVHPSVRRATLQQLHLSD
jgi:peptidoglycan/xylan/chitin deacetylase (PgdA/CDA1 family)